MQSRIGIRAPRPFVPYAVASSIPALRSIPASSTPPASQPIPAASTPAAASPLTMIAYALGQGAIVAGVLLALRRRDVEMASSADAPAEARA